MAHRFFRSMAVIAVMTLSACSSSSIVPSVQSVPSVPSSSADIGFYPMTSSNAAYQACPARARKPHEWRCYAWVRRDLRPVASGQNGIPAGVGYTPGDMASAYDFNPHAGAGQTVAIVDAYAYRTASVDLATYRHAAGLPPCTTSSGCLRILNEAGKRSPLPIYAPPSELGWLIEQSLDLDAVSAVCPYCKIVLIETNDSESWNLLGGVRTAVRLSKIVSMSFGSPDTDSTPPVTGLPTSGYALVASAGDFGGGLLGDGGPQTPCASTVVICVGGTTLTHSGTKWKSVVWNDERLNECFGPCGATGSGCSVTVSKPSWQNDTGCRMRSEADISADAGVTTPFAVYNSIFTTKSHWAGVGGTSLATPMIAAMIALAGNATSLHGAKEIWEHHESLSSVVRGSNLYSAVTGPCASSVRYICVAGRGYNGPTGWGSPRGLSDL
jgi:subtilase family serine protease